MGSSIIKRILQKYVESNFVKSIVILFSGTAIAQILPVLLTPLLSRLYQSSQFGVVFLYLSVVSVFSVVSTLKYEISIVLPKTKQTALYLYIGSLMMAFVVSCILYVLIIPGHGYLLHFFDSEKALGNWIYLIPVSVFCMGTAQASNFWLNRGAHFKHISAGKVVKSVSMVTSQTAFGFSKGFVKWNGLLEGVVIGQIFHSFYLAYIIIKQKILKNTQFSFRRLKKVMLYYQEIPKYNAPSGLVNMLSNNLPIFLLTSFYSIDTVGLFGMAMRLVATPMGMVNSSIGEVFYSKASYLYNHDKEKFVWLTKETTMKMVKMSIAPFVVLFFLAPKLFALLLGESWGMAGTYTQIILPWLFVSFINAHLTGLITIFRIQKQYLIFSILFLACRFFAFFIGYEFFNDAIYSLLLFALIGVVFNIFLLLYLLRLNNQVVPKKP
jgi:lipopolysaccharide exporter